MTNFLNAYVVAPRSKKRKRTPLRKQEQPARTLRRILVDSGQLCLRVHEVSEQQAVVQAGGWASVAHEVLGEQGEATQTDTEFWLHIGHMNHDAESFFMFSVLPLLQLAADHHKRLFKLMLPDPVQTFRSIEFFDQFLDKTKKWAFTAFQIDTTLEGYYDPGLPPNAFHVVHCMHIPERIMFWRGQEEEMRARARARPVGRKTSSKTVKRNPASKKSSATR